MYIISIDKAQQPYSILSYASTIIYLWRDSLPGRETSLGGDVPVRSSGLIEDCTLGCQYFRILDINHV